MNQIYFTPEALIFFTLAAATMASFCAMAYQAFHIVRTNGGQNAK